MGNEVFCLYDKQQKAFPGEGTVQSRSEGARQARGFHVGGCGRHGAPPKQVSMLSEMPLAGDEGPLFSSGCPDVQQGERGGQDWKAVMGHLKGVPNPSVEITAVSFYSF